jgi:hypothetical protein
MDNCSVACDGMHRSLGWGMCWAGCTPIRRSAYRGTGGVNFMSSGGELCTVQQAYERCIRQRLSGV